jgi:hypothetical protein
MFFLSWKGQVSVPGGPTEVSRGVHIDDAVIFKGQQAGNHEATIYRVDLNARAFPAL